jgi:hypothetical protein
MWVLKAGRPGPAVALGHKISEGVAISRRTMKIAWSNTCGQYPDVLAERESIIYTADIVEDGGQLKLANRKEILRAKLQSARSKRRISGRTIQSSSTHATAPLC